VLKRMTVNEAIIEFEERNFNCPYCGQLTLVELPLPVVEIIIALADCEHCGKEFLIEEDEPRVVRSEPFPMAKAQVNLSIAGCGCKNQPSLRSPKHYTL
jgi:DNA-directed RNA polymerase subunit RPC12/RpoP